MKRYTHPLIGVCPSWDTAVERAHAFALTTRRRAFVRQVRLTGLWAVSLGGPL